MKKLTDKIKKSLSGKKIKPKWQFISLNLLKDIGLVILLVAAILSLGIITYIIAQNNPWEFLPSGFRFFIKGLPLLPWELIVILCLIILAIYFLIKKVHFLYRLNNLIIIGAIMVITLGGYFIAEATGINTKIYNSKPFYKLHRNQGKFLFPNRGPRIRGEIRDINRQEITIKDWDGKEWQVRYSDDSNFPKNEDLEIGKEVTVVGEKSDSHINAFGIKDGDDGSLVQPRLRNKQPNQDQGQ